MTLLKLLAKENFIAYSKPIARIVGATSAIVFGELISVSNMFGDEEFYYQKERLEYDTCLGRLAVRSALKTLADFGLITITKKGIPCKNYYKINEERLIELLKDYEVKNTDDSNGGAVENPSCKTEMSPTSKADINPTTKVETDITTGVNTNPTTKVETDPTFKKINKRINTKKYNLNKRSAEKFSNDVYEKIETCYLETYHSLYEQKKLAFDKPPFFDDSYAKRRSRIKDLLLTDFVNGNADLICSAIKRAGQEEFEYATLAFDFMKITTQNNISKFFADRYVSNKSKSRQFMCGSNQDEIKIDECPF